MMLTELTKFAGDPDQILTPLWRLPSAERVWKDATEDDDWPPGRRRGPPPVRNRDRSR
jgi:hypothetical protein